jgi:6-phosphogluconolactonase
VAAVTELVRQEIAPPRYEVVDVELTVVNDADQASAAAARLLADAAQAGHAIALSGGSTPRSAYELAATTDPDWSRADVWFVDERMVSPEDPLSNRALVLESLVDRVASPPRTHTVHTELPPEDAAAAYDHDLRGAHIDLALLGIGRDGHTASLFPHAPALAVRDRLAVAAEPAVEPWVPRVTMTVLALSAVEHVVFLVTGSDKADAVRRAFAEPPSPATPASLVRSEAGRTSAILDRAAASLLQ